MLRQFLCRRSIYTHVVTLNVDFTLDFEPVENIENICHLASVVKVCFVSRLTDNEKQNIKYISL